MAEGTGPGVEVIAPPSNLAKVAEGAGQVAKKVGGKALDIGTTIAGRSLGLSGIDEQLKYGEYGSVKEAIGAGIAEFIAPNLHYSGSSGVEGAVRAYAIDFPKQVASLVAGFGAYAATGEVSEAVKTTLAVNTLLNAASHAINMPLLELRNRFFPESYFSGLDFAPKAIRDVNIRDIEYQGGK